MEANPLLLTVEAAADRLSVGRTTLFELISSGAVASVKIGRARRIPASALDEYVRRLTAEQVGAAA